jgi:MSHA biogenesis protein MshN
MSVVNDMLRDLDRRHGAQPALPFGAIAVVAPPRALPWRAMLLVVIALAVVAGIYSVAAPRLPAPTLSREEFSTRAAQPNQVPMTTAATPSVASTVTPLNAPQTSEEKDSVLSPLNSIENAASAAEMAPAAVSQPKTEAAEAIDMSSNAPAPIVMPAPIPAAMEKRLSQNPAALAEAAYRTAMTALHNGARGDAERELQNARALDPQHLPTVVALSRLYLEDGRIDAAQQLLEPALAAHADALDVRQLLARAQLGAGNPTAALQLLQARSPPVATYSDYHATAAALEQQLDDYEGAAERYRALLNVDAAQASWWLGLGLALDNLQHSDEARAAYARALALDNLPVAARSFAQQRLQWLQDGR